MCRLYDPNVDEKYEVEAVTETLEEAKDLAKHLVLMGSDEEDEPQENWEQNADEDTTFIYQFGPVYALKPQKDSVHTAFVMEIWKCL
jgi:hypothetical protein